MRETSGIDILTRLYDLSDLPHLDQLMFSIMGQSSAVPLQLHVMLQRFSFTEVQAVREATWGVRRLCAQTSVTLHNWDYAAPFDLRVPLLNWGLEVAQDRYVTCIDVHEQLRPRACAMLLGRLQRTDVALALGGATLQPVRWWGDVVLPVSGLKSEFVPACIFMADRSRLAVTDCVFRSGEPGSEIKEFVERIRTRYATDTFCVAYDIAVRVSPL
jgi:hypothetical protein